jgi:hypothetical protein
MTDSAEADFDREHRAVLAGHALEHVSSVYTVPEPSWDEIEASDYTIEEWHVLSHYMDSIISTARKFKKKSHLSIAEQLGVGSKAGVRLGDHFIREGEGGKWKVKEPQALKDFIRDMDAWEVVNVGALGAVTVTRLTQFLEGLGIDSSSAIDTFMEREPDGQPITILPIDKAPKFAAKLEHGEKYIPKPKKPAKPRLEAGE